MNDSEFFRKVDETLAGYRILTEEQRTEIAAQVASRGISYEHALHQAATVDPAVYKRVLEEVSGCTAIDPSQITIDDDFITSILDVVPLSAIVALKVFPVSLAGNDLTLAMLNPTDADVITELQSTTSLRIRPAATTHLGVQSAIERNFSALLRETLQELRTVRRDDVLLRVHEKKVGQNLDGLFERFLSLVNRQYESARKDPVQLAQFVAHPTVISYTQQLLSRIILQRCSDIHLEPASTVFRIRARVNGVLRTLYELPRKCGEAVAMRVRMMAGLELEQSPVPIDAQINYSPLFGRRIEFRVSVLPTIHGSKIVMRLLEKQNQSVTLDRIGLHPTELEQVRRNISAPNGLILVTGPTGSGKTSTLYSILHLLNDEERCIITAEEPVESEIPGVVQVACGADCSFALALRAFLRQDPDVIMVGEIRDRETADIALKAALTGHLVLSTLHTNDAPTAVMRLLNLEMDPFVVASSLRMVIAQRLIRTLCSACRQPVSRTELLDRFHHADIPVAGELYTTGGCEQCGDTGYDGRRGLFEILETNDEMADAISRGAPLIEIRGIAEKTGMTSLRNRALAMCAQGLTTVDEVVRVTAE
ncbi:MAG TPA: GspE/PulE family protein [Thermoanaerobaculia bacterium]|nr:GspE/PulE family protein [Thermoanaerobaculia bacterium]